MRLRQVHGFETRFDAHEFTSVGLGGSHVRTHTLAIQRNVRPTFAIDRLLDGGPPTIHCSQGRTFRAQRLGQRWMQTHELEEILCALREQELIPWLGHPPREFPDERPVLLARGHLDAGEVFGSREGRIAALHLVPEIGELSRVDSRRPREEVGPHAHRTEAELQV